MSELSKLGQTMKPSAIFAAIGKVAVLEQKGIKLSKFNAGQTDFPPPPGALEAVQKRLDEIKEHKRLALYTAAAGIYDLRKAIADKFKRDNKIDYTPEEVLVGTGAKQCLYNTMFVLLNQGDEVIVPQPAWPTYPWQIKMCNGTPVLCETEKETFNIKADILRKSVTDKTKAMILTSPCNPSGSVIHKAELKRITDLALEHDIWIVSDEVYEPFVYDGEEHKSTASFSEEVRGRTITINAASKMFSMTGWRIGFCAGPSEVMKMMNNMQGHLTSNACSLAQQALLGALTDKRTPAYVAKMVKEFKQRRNLLVKRFEDFGWFCKKPKGAFYAMPDISSTGLGSEKLCDELLDKARVSCLPGSAFGADHTLRFSYATAQSEIEAGMDRVAEWLKKK